MAQPINYMAMMPQVDLGQKFAQLGESIGDYGAVMQKRRADEQAAQMRQQYATELDAALKDGGQVAFARLMARYPGQREALGDAAKMLDTEQGQQEFSTGMQISSALENGSPEAARPLLMARVEAAKNAGKPPGIYGQILDALDRGDVTAAKGATNYALALAGGDRYTKAVESITKARTQPADIRKAEAEAKEKDATARVKDIESRFKEQEIKAGLALTRAQTGQANASADASRASADKSRKEGMQVGIASPQDRAELEGKLRKEYADGTKVYKDTKESYARVLAAAPGAIGDISLIYGFMKMQDPGSVVREGEYATAENARGVPDSIKNVYNKVVRGERLTDAQRNTFKGQASRLYKSALDSETTVRKGVERIAKNYGLNSENVFFESSETPPGVAPSANDMPPPGAVRLKGK